MRSAIIFLSKISSIHQKIRRLFIDARDHPSFVVKGFYLFYRLRMPIIFFLFSAGLYFSKINLSLSLLPNDQGLGFLILLQIVWLFSNLNRSLSEWIRRQYSAELEIDASKTVKRSGASYLQASILLNSGFFLLALLFLLFFPRTEESNLAVSAFFFVEILGACLLGPALSYYSLAAAKRRPWFDSFQIFGPRIFELLIIITFFKSLEVWSLVIGSVLATSLNILSIIISAKKLTFKFQGSRLEFNAVFLKINSIIDYLKPRFIFLLSIHATAIFAVIFINQVSSAWAMIFAFALILGQIVGAPTSRVGKTLYFDVQRALVKCEFYKASQLLDFSIVASLFSGIMAFGFCYMLWSFGFLHFGFSSVAENLAPKDFIYVSLFASIIAVRSSLNANVPLVSLASSSIYWMSKIYLMGLALTALFLLFEPINLEHLLALWIVIDFVVLMALAWQIKQQREKEYQFSPWLAQESLYKDSSLLLSLGRESYAESSHLKVCRGSNAFFNYVSLWFEMRKRAPHLQGSLLMIKWREANKSAWLRSEGRKLFLNSFRRTDIIWELPNKNLLIFLTGNSLTNLQSFSKRVMQPILTEVEVAKCFRLSPNEHILEAFFDRVFDQFPPRYLLMKNTFASRGSYSSLNQEDLNRNLANMEGLHLIDEPALIRQLDKEALGLRPWLSSAVLKSLRIIPIFQGIKAVAILDAKILFSRNPQLFDDLLYSSMEALIKKSGLNFERSKEDDQFWRGIFEHRYGGQNAIVEPSNFA